MKLSQQIFGMAFNSEYIPVGIMGAGPNLDGWDSEYPLVIDSLVQQGYIQSRAFSLDIRGLDAEEGMLTYMVHGTFKGVISDPDTRFRRLWRNRHQEVLRCPREAAHHPCLCISRRSYPVSS